MIPSSWRINKVFTKVSKVMNFLNIIKRFRIFFLPKRLLCSRWFVVSLLCSEWSEWGLGAHIDLISPWCYFLSSLSSTILLNNSSRPDKKRRNNTRTSQKQMRSHNTRAITRRDGHFLCSVSNSFSKIGLFKYRRWIFSRKKCFMFESY